MSREDFQREVEDVFRAAAPRTMARRAAGRHYIKAAQGGIAVNGNNNTVVVGQAHKEDDPKSFTCLLVRIRPWSRLFARIYAGICTLWLAAALADIYGAAGGMLAIGEWVRANGLFFLVQASVGAALLTATIVGPYWLLSRLFHRAAA